MNQVWTDGACAPNPGPGGWGYLMLRPGGGIVEEFGGELITTNNRMELTAILMALKSLGDGKPAVIHSDSQYAVSGLTVWSKSWARRGWHKKDGNQMPNRDLWVALEAQKQRVRAAFKWVRGHSGDPGNERADALAGLGLMTVCGRRS